MIRVVTKRPGEPPVVTLVDSALEQLQELVGGDLELIRLDGFDLYVNENGRLEHLARNFETETWGPILGPVFLSKTGKDGEPVSLTDDEAAHGVALLASQRA